ncbi:MAG: N-acetylmuramoyl-L-alanine amidase [Alphaproteobacteria bacterium]|nr:N-acetylmuramoyl-L-alanine amidase [Alphaproteobacteria bacterium]
MIKKILLLGILFIIAWEIIALGEKEPVKMMSYASGKREKPVKHLVIHSFENSPKEMLNILSQYGLSVHYLIEANGKVHRLVPEKNVAWHAGPSFWAGDTGLNWTSIGIELAHPQFGQTDYPQKQINILKKLVKSIIKRYHIRPENIVAHSDIAPEAKMDPGRGFPWKQLADEGIGLWYDSKDTNKMSNLTVSELLSTIGYSVKGRALEASSWAFRQRFMPEVVPYDDKIAERGEAMFQARQKAASLSPAEREKFLSVTPAIYPPNDGTYLTDPDFIKVLRAVAYQYKKARKK